MNTKFALTLCLFASTLTACNSTQPISDTCETVLTVLGNAQDAGKPQMGRHGDTAWRNPAEMAPATSLGLTFSSTGERYLFDATPDIKAQMYALDILSSNTGFRLDGIFLTHAHMGHYLGLAQLGREAMGADNIPVYAMPKMKSFLESNGPWDLLVRLGNIDIQPLTDNTAIELNTAVSVMPFLVPHREEYSETVGYRISSGGQNAVYLPDIDSWDAWASEGTNIANVVEDSDILFLDATFFSGDELPGRDMSQIPHPTISHTMERLAALPTIDKAKIHFIHTNHTNPALRASSEASQQIKDNGFNIARTGQQHCLGD